MTARRRAAHPRHPHLRRRFLRGHDALPDLTALRRRAVRSGRRADAHRRSAHARVADDVRGALRGVGHRRRRTPSATTSSTSTARSATTASRACCAAATSRCRGAIRRIRSRPTRSAASATARTPSSSACCAARASPPYPGSVALLDLLAGRRHPDRRRVEFEERRRGAAVAGLRDRFHVVMDGVIAERDHLASKPAPDVFLEGGADAGRRTRTERRRRRRPERRASPRRRRLRARHRRRPRVGAG